jgi:6-phosphogluconolactonase (cycloisomerase 2 family)
VIGGQFSVFAIDSNTGAPMEISGSPFSYQSNAEPSGIGMHPSGKFLYTALSNSAGVDGVSVNTATGALTLIKGAPWSTGSFLPDYVAMAPSGSFLYVSQKGTGAVNAFTIDRTSGALTLVQTLDGGNPSLLGSREPTLLCNQVDWRFVCVNEHVYHFSAPGKLSRRFLDRARGGDYT